MPLLKDAVLGGLSFLKLPHDRAVILMYHSIHERIDYFANVEPSAFAAQMEIVAKSGRPVISLGELVRRISSGEPLGGSIVITFDDGYRDNYTAAYPILKRHGFPATIFVVTGLIGQTDKRGLERLNESEIRELHGSGLIDIEPHTVSHPKLARLSREDAASEIRDSKQALERMLSKVCAFFAYPYGDFTQDTERLVRDVGYRASTGVRHGTVGPDTDVFALPRVSIDGTTTVTQFRGKISRAIDVLSFLKGE